MKIRIAYITIALSICYSMGFDALSIPSNFNIVSLSGAGVASDNVIGINPASNLQSDSKLGFSTNNWILGIRGSALYYSENSFHINYHSFGVDDIEVRSKIPSDDPLDVIGSNIYCLRVSKSYNVFKKLNLGIGTQFSHSQIFTEKKSSFTYNLGARLSVLKGLSFGGVIKNIGASKYEIPFIYCLGASYINEKIKTEVMFDFEYSDRYEFGYNFGLLKRLSIFDISLGYSKFLDLRTTLSSGLKVKLKRKYNLAYSVLSIHESNFDLVHYLGIEFSL